MLTLNAFKLTQTTDIVVYNHIVSINIVIHLGAMSTIKSTIIENCRSKKCVINASKVFQESSQMCRKYLNQQNYMLNEFTQNHVSCRLKSIVIYWMSEGLKHWMTCQWVHKHDWFILEMLLTFDTWIILHSKCWKC